MRPFIYLYLILSLYSCSPSQKTNQQKSSDALASHDSALTKLRLHYVHLSTIDSSVYLFDISQNYIGIRRQHQNLISLHESIEKLKDLLPKYFSAYPDSSTFNLGFSDGILSQYNFKFNQKEVSDFLGRNQSHELSPNALLNQVLFYSNFKDEINSIFKPYGYMIHQFSNEKVDFDFKAEESSSTDSITFSPKFFIGFLHIKMIKYTD